MLCGECKYYDASQRFCKRHWTKQNKNVETSCGEYAMQDKDGSEIDGRLFYLKKNLTD